MGVGGRPPHEPTDETRRQVTALAGYGLNQQQIAAIIGIGRSTLQTHYQEELDSGKAKASAKVAQTAYEMAISGKVPAMTMFWLKTQCRWKENHDAPSEDDINKVVGLPNVNLKAL